MLGSRCVLWKQQTRTTHLAEGRESIRNMIEPLRRTVWPCPPLRASRFLSKFSPVVRQVNGTSASRYRQADSTARCRGDAKTTHTLAVTTLKQKQAGWGRGGGGWVVHQEKRKVREANVSQSWVLRFRLRVKHTSPNKDPGTNASVGKSQL